MDANLSVIPDLALAYEDRPFDATVRPSRGWQGFAVEHVVTEGVEPYSFQWRGDTHYVALHDILLNDGGSVVDGIKPDATRDLRNTITFLPSGCSIEGWCLPARRVNSFTALYFKPGLLRDDLDLRYREVSLQPILYAREGRLQESMRKLSALIADPYVDDVYAESACILAAIEALGLKHPEKSGALTNRQIRMVSEYVAAHLTEEISLSDLAAAANLSRYHFARAFKAGTGQSPYVFVMAQRVERASELLAASDLPIEAVASLAGFGTTARLRRYFQQLKGETPRTFRRRFG
jgi:AraC family transcriptional regulator